jgi:hypothetical protein
MTEAEWLTCTDIPPFVEFLRGKASDRKLRLFEVACCRRVWNLLPDDDTRRAVEVAELFADGQASRESLEDAARRAKEGADQVHEASKARLADPAGLATDTPAWGDEQLRRLQGYYMANLACRPNTEWRKFTTLGSISHGRRLEEFSGAGQRPPAVGRVPYFDLLRDIFGPLLFRPVVIAPAWLRWNNGAVPAIARRVYYDRAYHDLPILAGALEDAGCTNPDIHTHCRGEGPHVRGCWVVDLILGRE